MLETEIVSNFQPLSNSADFTDFNKMSTKENRLKRKTEKSGNFENALHF